MAQPIRKVPYHLRDKLSTKLDELVELDIIEKVSGPSSWVSPVVVVPKPSGDIRLCVDMRQAHMAVKRERFPIPTIDEVLQDLNESQVFIVCIIEHALWLLCDWIRMFARAAMVCV